MLSGKLLHCKITLFLPWRDGTSSHDLHFLNVDATVYVYVFFGGVWFSCASNWFSRNMVNLGQGNHRCYRDSVLHDGWRFSKFEFLKLLLWWKIYVLRLTQEHGEHQRLRADPNVTFQWPSALLAPSPTAPRGGARGWGELVSGSEDRHRVMSPLDKGDSLAFLAFLKHFLFLKLL